MRYDLLTMLPEQAFLRGPNGCIKPQGKSAGKAPPPDPSIGEAQKKMAALAEQQYEDYKTNVWPEIQRQSAHQQKQADAWQAKQTEVADRNMKLANDYQKRMEEKFYPLQDKMIDQANEYNTEGNFESQASRALGDSNTATENARKMNAMQMEAYGINPASGAYANSNNAANVMGAANAATAATRAYSAAKELGWNMNAAAAGLGANLPGQINATTGVALGAGNSGLQAGQTGIGNAMTLGNSYSQGAGTVGGIYNNSGQLGASSYNTQVQAWAAQQQANAQSSAGFGAALGAIGGAMISGGAGGFGFSPLGMGLQGMGLMAKPTK